MSYGERERGWQSPFGYLNHEKKRKQAGPPISDGLAVAS